VYVGYGFREKKPTTTDNRRCTENVLGLSRRVNLKRNPATKQPLLGDRVDRRTRRDSVELARSVRFRSRPGRARKPSSYRTIDENENTNGYHYECHVHRPERGRPTAPIVLSSPAPVAEAIKTRWKLARPASRSRARRTFDMSYTCVCGRTCGGRMLERSRRHDFLRRLGTKTVRMFASGARVVAAGGGGVRPRDDVRRPARPSGKDRGKCRAGSVADNRRHRRSCARRASCLTIRAIVLRARTRGRIGRVERASPPLMDDRARARVPFKGQRKNVAVTAT